VLDSFAAVHLGGHNSGEGTGNKTAIEAAAKLLRKVADAERDGRLTHLDKLEV